MYPNYPEKTSTEQQYHLDRIQFFKEWAESCFEDSELEEQQTAAERIQNRVQHLQSLGVEEAEEFHSTFRTEWEYSQLKMRQKTHP